MITQNHAFKVNNSGFVYTMADTSSSYKGLYATIGVLSLIVLVSIIGFIVVATMPQKDGSTILQSMRRPKVVDVFVSEGSNQIPQNSGKRLPQNVGSRENIPGQGALKKPNPTSDSGQQMLGGTGLIPSAMNTQSPAPAPSSTQYQDNVAMQPPIMSVVTNAAANAFKIEQDSQRRVQSYAPNGSQGDTVPGRVPPGGGDEDMRLAQIPALAQNLDNSGYIPKVIAHAGGPAMAHSFPTTITAAAFSKEINEDGYLAQVDPETNAEVNAALALTGVPATFGLDQDQYERRKAAEIIRTMELVGAADPSIEQVMAASTPFIATQDILRRATQATGRIDSEIIIEAPMRFLYANPGYRLSTPGVTLSPVVAENSAITPAQEYYMLQTGCFDGTCALGAKQEPY